LSRWFRSYADTHRNPKVARLSDSDFRLWHQLLCIAAENEGVIPPATDLKNLLNRRLDHLSSALKRLVKEELIDLLDDGFTPRNWEERQYKSDTSAERTRKWRASRDVTVTAAVTAPDTDTDTDTEKEVRVMPDKSGAFAFFGQTIKLTPRHLNEWRRLFHSIPDLDAELSTLDSWWQTQPEAKRENWFLATKGMLNKKHQRNMAEEKDEARAAVWDGMP
jgi:hypothetical protein